MKISSHPDKSVQFSMTMWMGITGTDGSTLFESGRSAARICKGRCSGYAGSCACTSSFANNGSNGYEHKIRSHLWDSFCHCCRSRHNCVRGTGCIHCDRTVVVPVTVGVVTIQEHPSEINELANDFKTTVSREAGARTAWKSNSPPC